MELGEEPTSLNHTYIYPNWGMLIDEVAIVTCEPPSLKRLLQYELTTNVPHQTDLSTGPNFQRFHVESNYMVCKEGKPYQEQKDDGAILADISY